MNYMYYVIWAYSVREREKIWHMQYVHIENYWRHHKNEREMNLMCIAKFFTFTPRVIMTMITLSVRRYGDNNYFCKVHELMEEN